MHTTDLSKWQHDHTFGQDEVKAGERATILVILITSIMMVAEIVTGTLFGSMALLADGLHMASHTVALGISVFAYIYARKFSADRRYSFGTGKVNALAGFTSAILLLGFALTMAVESVDRFLNPVEIAFNQALFVAGVGLVVNVVSAWILAASGTHSHDHGHDHSHEHSHKNDYAPGNNHADEHTQQSGEEDHNLKSAYFHVVADALTSILAIVALMAGKWFGLNWMDPAMGIVGALLVSQWSIGLIRNSSRTLLDWQASDSTLTQLHDAIENGSDDKITDVHMWSIAPGKYAAEIVIVSHETHQPDDYRARIPKSLNIAHAIIEIRKCHAA
ncbi:MAG: CDF family Co(II)/Ni(II) efflux transporter DmeF [Rhodospirillaceae bacterium]